MGDSRSKRFPAEDNPFSRLDSDPLERLMMIMIMLMMRMMTIMTMMIMILTMMMF